MGINERKQREQEAKKQRIIDAAVKMFVEEGIEQLSIRKIAQQIEYSPATLYLYFESKSHLIEEMMIVINRQFLDTLQQSLDAWKDESIERRLKNGLAAYISFGLEHPDYYRLLFMKETAAAVSPADTEHYKGYLLLQNLIEEARTAGVLKPKYSIAAVTLSVSCGLHGLVSLMITKPNFEWGDPRAFIGFHIESLIRSFTTTVNHNLDAGEN